ncbi:hypothetical protein GW17_00047404 [Ensete ventricosum]|nr:hypothetical protein GW17_00047404 [Ensete ventricosum]
MSERCVRRLRSVLGAPSRSGSPHNGVQAASTRGAPRRQFEVDVCGAQVVTLMRVLLSSLDWRSYIPIFQMQMEKMKEVKRPL